jgi:hypothetical protein
VGDLLDLPIDEFSIEGPTVFLVTGCVWTSTGLSLELAAGVRQSWAIADQKNLVYYYQDTNSPGALWVKLDKIDFKEGSGVRKLTLVGKPDTTGDQTTNFEKSEPFKFLAPH